VAKVKATTPKVTWDGTRIVVPAVFLESWSEAYPNVDLGVAIKRASAWMLTNPTRGPKKAYGRFLHGWFGRVKPGDPEYIDPEEQAASDAELIRGAEQTFPDPNERADFYWQRKQRGRRVPAGVICKPMLVESEKEAAI
jgi:hypothetical protein